MPRASAALPRSVLLYAVVLAATHALHGALAVLGTFVRREAIERLTAPAFCASLHDGLGSKIVKPSLMVVNYKLAARTGPCQLQVRKHSAGLRLGRWVITPAHPVCGMSAVVHTGQRLPPDHTHLG